MIAVSGSFPIKKMFVFQKPRESIRGYVLYFAGVVVCGKSLIAWSIWNYCMFLILTFCLAYKPVELSQQQNLLSHSCCAAQDTTAVEEKSGRQSTWKPGEILQVPRAVVSVGRGRWNPYLLMKNGTAVAMKQQASTTIIMKP